MRSSNLIIISVLAFLSCEKEHTDKHVNSVYTPLPVSNSSFNPVSSQKYSYSNNLDDPLKNIREATESANNYSQAQIKQGEDAMAQINESHRKMNEDYEHFKMLQNVPLPLEINEYSPLPYYETTSLENVRYQVQSEYETKAKNTVYQNSNDVKVNGYFKSDGTYVESYIRTEPNETIEDNYSTSPNINPYTGKVGTK